MKDTQKLEKTLESLVPRQPSERIKARLFSSAVERGADVTRLARIPMLACLVPAACCMLLMCIHLGGFRQDTGRALMFGSNVTQLAAMSSNLQTYYAGEALGGRENLWKVVTFEWTKAGEYDSTTGSFPMGKTNIQKL